MPLSRRVTCSLLAVTASVCHLPAVAWSQASPSQYSHLQWRLIGPHRGGRTVAAVGVPGQAHTFYIGVNNGGVWKTTDAGRVWAPVFDDQPTGSVGAIAVAPSDPSVIYVGSGEGLQRPDLSTGDGIYRSSDAGRTWRHLGLRDGYQIPAVIVDPRDPNRVFVAVLGHPYGPNEERGVFRSLDGGANWEKVLYADANTGAFDVAFDPSNPQTLFAVLWAGRQTPWEAGGLVINAGNGLYKSTDGGTTWRKVGSGLPGADSGLGRIGLGMSSSEPRRMYAIVGAQRGGGLYRSDDGGEGWRPVNSDNRLWSRDGDFNEVKVDPKDADVVYVANIAAWKSTDGGAHFSGFRGAPGGDDPHRFWINPDDPRIILLAGDQGAIVTLNGGETWSSWYNQPTAQAYHIITDNAFPYRVYASQQESGSSGMLSRGPDGQITFRDWRPVGVEEYGYIAPDPRNPDIVFGGKLTRFNWRTGEVRNVAPEAIRSGQYRYVRTLPVIFSPVDQRSLYFAGNVIWKTVNGGDSWTIISPDLTRPQYEVPATLGAFTALDPARGAHRGVVYTIAPSFRSASVIWAGTDDGLIWVTRNGGARWQDVTPPALTPWSKVSLMEASHSDVNTAYAAVNRFRLDDLRPHIYRTRDGGSSWTEIVRGIPDNEVVNVVREDPVRPGLLFAGTERSVYVSFNDGDQWHPLKQNLPPSSMRDLYIHESDLVVGTHGRSNWVLDNYALLRELAEDGQTAGRSDGHASRLYRPVDAWRVRWNRNTDTPLPPEEPAGQNPPEGAGIDYQIAERRSVTPIAVHLEILDRSGRLVRRFSSTDAIEPVDSSANFPAWWIRPPQRLYGGLITPQRFYWDLRYPPPAAVNREWPIAAIRGNTPREPRGPFVLPGTYTVRLIDGSDTLTQSLTVRMDPRVGISALALQQQHNAAMRVMDAISRDSTALDDARTLRTRATGAQNDSLAAVARDLTRLNGQLVQLLGVITGAEAAPTSQAMRAIGDLERALRIAQARLDANR